MVQPRWDYIELMATIVWDVFEEFSPTNKVELNKCISEAKRRYINKRKLGSVSGYPHDYLMEVKKQMLRWNFSDDEAMQVANNKYGYNPYTGKWDGSYEGCEVGRKNKDKKGKYLY